MAFVNDAGFELAALIEDRTWVRDALTAPEVISLQAFRDLFAEATLRPGDDAGVSQVALLFTDLQGSTALYERVGDAAAYNIVREHFALLAAIVRDHDGAVVKTIGDAVMASFSDPAQAVRAAIAMQAEIGSSAQGVRDLVLKVGVHAGPSVVVTLNDRLDYFGSTVNMAARLQGQSTGGDIVLSRAVADDPAVREVLAAVPKRQETVALKGFAEPVGFVRLLPLASDCTVSPESSMRTTVRSASWIEQRPRTAGHQLTRHDDPLDLAGALPDSLHPKFAEHPLGDVLPHVAAAAEDLHGAIGHPARHLRAVQLRHRGLAVQGLAVMAGVDGPGHLVEHRSGGEQFGRAVGQHARHQLMLTQRPAVDHPGLRERRRLVDQSLRGANASRGHHHPLEPEPVLRERHRSALGPDEVRHREPGHR